MKQHEAVLLAMKQNGGYATLGQLYQTAPKIPGSTWGTKTPFATIRRIVQQYDEFFKIRPGLWALASEKEKVMRLFSGETKQPKEKNIALSTETVNGKQYRVGVIRKMALFPTQSGTLEIAPMEATTQVQLQSRCIDQFDAFFRDPFERTVNYKVKSEPLKIKVDPLPPMRHPASRVLSEGSQ